MKYYFKLSRNLLYKSIGVLICTLFFACHILWRPKYGKSEIDSFYYYGTAVWSIALIVHIINNYKLIIKALKKEPLFEANETYVFDSVSNVKYYWNDIEAIDANEEDRVLYINVNDPAKYLSFFSNFYNRYHYYSKRKKRFNLDLDCVKADMKNLITVLNNYSIQAQEMDGSKV